MSRRLPALAAIAALLLAGCGSGDPAATTSATSSSATPAAGEPHPCDLLTTPQATEALGIPVADVVRVEAVESEGGQASCEWIGPDYETALGLILEGPGFFSAAGPGYGSSGEAYDFWRRDALDAGFEVGDLEGVGDAAFVPRIGEGPHNTLVVREGDYLLHVSLLAGGPDLEDRMVRSGRLAAEALSGG